MISKRIENLEALYRVATTIADFLCATIPTSISEPQSFDYTLLNSSKIYFKSIDNREKRKAYRTLRDCQLLPPDSRSSS